MAWMYAFHAAERNHDKRESNCQAYKFPKLRHGKPPWLSRVCKSLRCHRQLSLHAAVTTRISERKWEGQILALVSCLIEEVFIPGTAPSLVEELLAEITGNFRGHDGVAVAMGTSVIYIS